MSIQLFSNNAKTTLAAGITSTQTSITVAPGTGEDLTLANRRGLHPYWNYDFIDQEAPTKVNPLGDSASSRPRSAMPVADTFNNQMGANY